MQNEDELQMRARQKSTANRGDRQGVEQEDEKGVELSPLYLFLASSLNVELVFVILKSISLFASVKSDG